MKNKLEKESIKHIISVLSKSDVILCNGKELFIGLYCKKNNSSFPIVLFKGSRNFNDYILRFIELLDIPCIENKILSTILYEEVREKKYVPGKYLSQVQEIYKSLSYFKEKDDFVCPRPLRKKVAYQVNNLESFIYHVSGRKYLRKNKEPASPRVNVSRDIYDSIMYLAEYYKLNCKIFHNETYYTTEFYLEFWNPKKKKLFWIMLMVHVSNQTMYVCNNSLFFCLRLTDINLALENINCFFQKNNKSGKTIINKNQKEVEINLRLHDMVCNSIKTLLELNYNRSGTKYSYDDSSKKFMKIYLKEKPDSLWKIFFQCEMKRETSKIKQFYYMMMDLRERKKRDRKKRIMYTVCIYYNEFLRNPEGFKQFIRSPKIKRQKNFWCRISKYKSEYFEEKNQTITT